MLVNQAVAQERDILLPTEKAGLCRSGDEWTVVLIGVVPNLEKDLALVCWILSTEWIVISFL